MHGWIKSLAGWLCLLAAIAAAAACGEGPDSARVDPSSDKGTQPIKAVATIGMITDVVRQVGGERVSVTGLMGEGVDPHLYKASPGDVRAMSDADIIFYNGLHLEGRMADVIVRMASSGSGNSKRTVVRATETIDETLLREPPEFEGHFDPHVWFDVSMWRSVVSRVRDALIEKDEAGKDAYTTSAAEYDATLTELHTYAKETLATIPEQNRVLVTAHDAFGYFGRAYGLEVLAIQGISTDSEASLQDINALVDTLVKRQVPAVFIESSVPRKTVDALVEGCKGRGHSIIIGGELFSDAMGKSSTLGGTYVGMVLHNVEAIASALGGTVPTKRPARLAAFAARFAEKSESATTPRQAAPTHAAPTKPVSEE